MSDLFSPNSSRRRLLRRLGLISGAALIPGALRSVLAPTAGPSGSVLSLDAVAQPTPTAAAGVNPHRVVLVKTSDRAAGVSQSLDLLQPAGFQDKRVFIKPNYNTGDPAPAATDPAVLEALVKEIQGAGASQITVGDRSGMAETRRAMEQMQVFTLAERYGFTPLVFDELGQDDWQYFSGEGTNWSQGFALA